MSDADNVSCDDGCCKRSFSFTLTSGITIFSTWLDLRTTSNPKCFIQEFYVPALNTTVNSTSTRNITTIPLHLRFENVITDKSVLYDANLTIFYGNNSLPIANHKVGKTKQGNMFHKKVTKEELVQTHGVPWDEAYQAALRNDWHFGVGLATRIRFRIWTKTWYINTKRHDFMVGANVTVDFTQVARIPRRKIRLKSGDPPTCGSHLAWVVLSILSVS